MYHNPVRVIQTHDWLSECRARLDELAIETPLVVTSEGGKERLRLEEIFTKEAIFSRVTPNPTLSDCEAAIDFAKNGEADGVIAIGGGSVMDTAKTVMGFLGTGLDSISQLLTVQKPFTHRVPAIFIPTTHGTGSEVTIWGTIWSETQNKKLSISHPDLYPDYAILDAHLTLTLPLNISLATTLDALSHSLEAIWNKHANKTSSAYAQKAIGLILKYTPRLKAGPRDLEVRTNLLSAATTAGLAISNTRTAAAHSISYPLTIHFGVPHGIASSLALLPLLDINASAIQNTLKALFQELEIAGREDLKAIIREIPKGYLKYRLRDWGVRREQLDWLTTQCFTVERMDNNIVDLSQGQVREILEEIY